MVTGESRGRGRKRDDAARGIKKKCYSHGIHADLPPKEEKRWRQGGAGAGAGRETMPHAASKKKAPLGDGRVKFARKAAPPPKCGNIEDYLTIIVIAAFLGGVHAFLAMRVPLAPQFAAIP